MPAAITPAGAALLRKMAGGNSFVVSSSAKFAVAASQEGAGHPKKGTGRWPLPKRGQVKVRIVGTLVRSFVTMVSRADGRRSGDGCAAAPAGRGAAVGGCGFE